MTDDKDMKFEEALSRLEQIVTDMEGGELSLEQSMQKFEEGMVLARLCSAKLGEAEKKIEILVKKADAACEWRRLDQADAEDETGDEPESDSRL